MKTKVKTRSFEEVSALPAVKHRRPMKPNLFFRTVLKVASVFDLMQTKFTCKKVGMERLSKKDPCLYLMNHSCFLDLEIAAGILYPRPFNIVCTSDGFVGKDWLMRLIGCIPTQKFVTDTRLVKDMIYALKTRKSSVLMYPEASYSFDGTATPLPDSLGKCVKLLKVPVVMIRTYGAFQRDPLYNGLQKRKVAVSATMTYLLSPEEIERKSAEEINGLLQEQFTFDHFRWQQENGIRVTEPFRADYLHRVLYKCPHCMAEGQTTGKGTELRCSCGAAYELTESGTLRCLSGEGKFDQATDWYRWERDCVREEIETGQYRLDVPVKVMMQVDFKAIYRVGEGRLVHDGHGFALTACDGKLRYRQSPASSYSLYADYYWYELGDVIGIGDKNALYYCFPPEEIPVAKARLATEELYRLGKA